MVEMEDIVITTKERMTKEKVKGVNEENQVQIADPDSSGRFFPKDYFC